MAKFTKIIKYSKYGIAFSLSALLGVFLPTLNSAKSTNNLSDSDVFNINTVYADAPWVVGGDGGYGDGDGASGCGDGSGGSGSDSCGSS